MPFYNVCVIPNELQDGQWPKPQLATAGPCLVRKVCAGIRQSPAHNQKLVFCKSMCDFLILVCALNNLISHACTSLGSCSRWCSVGGMRVDGVMLHPAVGRRRKADRSGGVCVPSRIATAAELPQGSRCAPAGSEAFRGTLLGLGSSRCSYLSCFSAVFLCFEKHLPCKALAVFAILCALPVPAEPSSPLLSSPGMLLLFLPALGWAHVTV